jgi:hypothetical protein
MQPQTQSWSKDKSGCTFTHPFIPEVITVFLPPFEEVPDLWNSSHRFPGVDQTPVLPSGMGPDWELTFSEGLLSLDEIARQVGTLLLGVQLGQDYSECWNSRQRRTQNTVGWHTTLFGPESLPTLVLSSHQLVQGARMVGILLGPPEMLWKYFQTRN